MAKTEHLQLGYRHISYEDVGSTNEIAREMGLSSDPGNVWITATRQISGKGSRGRSWVSEPGNLYSSLLLRIDQPVTVLSNLTFVVSLAVQQAISQIVPENQLRLKWPNDVLLNSRKVCGILLENHSHRGQSFVVIGIGINCQTHPAETKFPATNLLDEGYISDPSRLFTHLVAAMDEMLKLWDEGRNFDAVRRAWLSTAYGIGQNIQVVTAKKHLTGRFEELDRDGCLILKTPDNRLHTISTADIFLNSDLEVQNNHE